MNSFDFQTPKIKMLSKMKVCNMGGTIRFFLFMLVCLLTIKASGQFLPDSVIEQRLVQLALNGPEMQEMDHQGKVYQYQLKNAKNQWMNLLTFSLNYNDQSLKQPVATAAYVYPKYFFGLNIPLGTLLSRTQVHAANEAIEIGKLNAEELKRKITADVLTKYRQYKAQSDLIALATGSMNDVEAALVEAKDKFRKNEITFEAYNLVQQTRIGEQAKIINLKLEQDVIKLDIERMIGTSLETVLK